MFDLKTHLKTLVETHAPSGHEGPIREVVQSAWESLVDSFEQDRLGSLIGIKRATNANGPARKIMLAAHMDEIGLMVRDIVDGFILIHRVAGIDNRLMMAQPVLVHGRETLPGIVATTPPHLLKPEDRKKYPDMDDLIVDTGLPAEEVNRLVRIGDLITPDAPMLTLNGQLVAGKAFDDRACVAAVTACLNELQRLQHSWDVYATATVQEESGLFGARTAANYIKPDIAIALDVTFAPQAGVNNDDASDINEGPVIALGANIHPKLFDRLMDTAKKYEIKHQTEAMPANTGTDAWAIQVAHEGIPTALISIPIRNMHSPVETLDLRDIERSGRLLAQFIATLEPDFFSTSGWDEESDTDAEEKES